MNLFIIIAGFFFLLTIFIILKLFWGRKIPEIINGKHVLITGGSSGIGKFTAIEAARLGAHVTIVARNEEKLESTAEEIRKTAKDPELQRINYISLDVAKGYDSVEKKFREIEDLVGPIYLLVNCAGNAQCGTIEETSELDYRHMMDLNFFGTVFPTLCVAKRMKMRRKGHIVITGSQLSLIGIYGMSAYCSSKFALRGFAESLHMELSSYNVTVTLCLPPDTNTPGFEIEEKSKPEITKLISKNGGLFEPQVVAYNLLYDALSGQFFSTVGFESLILTTLCSGMSPVKSLLDGVLPILSMSFLKLISIGYSLYFQLQISSFLKSFESKSSAFKSD